MAAPPPAKSLNLSVANFGPIIEADIDLRPLTVFVGPSNAGKSYMATLIYALHRFFNDNVPLESAIHDMETSVVFERFDSIENALTDVGIWLEQSARISESEPLPPVPALLESLALRSLDMSEQRDGFIDEALRCFGKDSAERLIRHGSGSEARIAIKISVPEGSNAVSTLEYEVAMAKNGGGLFRSDIPKAVSPEIANRAALAYLREYPSYLRRRIGELRANGLSSDWGAVALTLDVLGAAVGGEFIAPLNNPARYLPASRTGIMQTHQTFASSLIAGASRAGLRRRHSLPAVSGVLADFLVDLISFRESLIDPNRESAHLKAADSIEKKILAGAAEIAESPTGYPQFQYRPSGWKEPLPLTGASSMVSELAPVILYLRHVVSPGDTLIIEEPESHLHPAMQVEFARQLAAVTLAGVRVIITTHSEWILDELSNLTLLSQLDESNRDGISGADSALDPESVGVWLFRPKAEGTTVNEIPFVDEYGGYSEDYTDVMLDAYNSHAEIFNRAQEAKGE